METMEIYFSDLNEDAQKRFLEFEGISTPEEGNYDSDIVPIAVLERSDD